jgi:TPR repeat protein
LSAAQGDDEGEYQLGVMYENALGVPQDRKTGLMWYLLSAAQDNEDAKKAADRIKAQMSGSDIRAAQAMAAGFKPVKAD